MKYYWEILLRNIIKKDKTIKYYLERQDDEIKSKSCRKSVRISALQSVVTEFRFTFFHDIEVKNINNSFSNDLIDSLIITVTLWVSFESYATITTHEGSKSMDSKAHVWLSASLLVSLH